MSAPSPPAVVVAPRPPQTGHNFELGNGGGGPPPLATAVLSHLAAGWPALADLRAAASARQGSGRLRNEISALVCDVRVALAAAFLGGLPDEGGNTTRRSEEDALDAAASCSVASRVYSDARTLLVDCGPALRSHWRLSDAQWRELRVALESVVGPAVVLTWHVSNLASAARCPRRDRNGWCSNMVPLSFFPQSRMESGLALPWKASAFLDMAHTLMMIDPFIQTPRFSGP
jgi:hypothetical protein